MKLWVGLEKEGNLANTKTLFIGSPSININSINKALKKYKDIKQLYFGAGHCTLINQNVVRNAIKKYPELIITLELYPKKLKYIDKEILDKVLLMITIEESILKNLIGLDNKKYQIKLQTLLLKNFKFIGVGNINQIINPNELTGVIYDGDIVIE